MMDFEQIEQARKAAGLTRAAVYRPAGVDKNTWTRLERGRNKPNLGTLEKLAGALEALLAERKDDGRSG